MVKILLIDLLHKKNVTYYTKILELRDSMKTWLGYIPNTFPHYTDHSIKHSDSILNKLSQILFIDNDINQCKINFSAIELFVLCSAAYLHDCGMVIADDEKAKVLQLDGWKKWIASEGVSQRYKSIENLRHTDKGDKAVYNFLADTQLRYLIAEYIRKQHHYRVKDVLTLNSDLLGNILLNDKNVLETIGDVCISHGISIQELSNKKIYPEERTLQDELINVRLISCLLRIGDLLDTSGVRGCQIARNAAGALPDDSHAHWDQFNRIEHSVLTNNKIEYVIKCNSQHEHNLLHDWFNWLVDEVVGLNTWLPYSKRHKDWLPPIVSIGNENSTILIDKSDSANYRVVDWKFNFNHEKIIELLVSKIHTGSFGFVRELIQNSLDSMRCRSAVESNKFKIEERVIKNNYKLTINITKDFIVNDSSGEHLEVINFEILDDGLGMNEEILTKYFLQIGYSYYTSSEFKKKSFSFSPMSRFGIGFLTVFSVSNDVEVETSMSDGDGERSSIYLEIKSPSNYILVEDRKVLKQGTRIKVKNISGVVAQDVINYIVDFCKMVEFRIEINFDGKAIIVNQEDNGSCNFIVEGRADSGEVFNVESLSIDTEVIKGSLYLLEYKINDKIYLNKVNWAERNYAETHLNARPVILPKSFLARNGLNIYSISSNGITSNRLNYLGDDVNENLSRSMGNNVLFEVKKETDLLLELYLYFHLENDWNNLDRESLDYKLSLCSLYSVFDFWKNIPGTVEVFQNGKIKFISFEECMNLESSLNVVFYGYSMINKESDFDTITPFIKTETNESYVYFKEFLKIPSTILNEMFFSQRQCVSLKFIKGLIGYLTWEKTNDRKGDYELFFKMMHSSLGSKLFSFDLAFFDDDKIIGFEAGNYKDASYGDKIIFNLNNQSIIWFIELSIKFESANDEQKKQISFCLKKIMLIISDVVTYYRNVKSELECINVLMIEIHKVVKSINPPVYLKEEAFIDTYITPIKRSFNGKE